MITYDEAECTYSDKNVPSRDVVATFADFAHLQLGAFIRRALAESLDGLGGSSHL